MLLGDADAFTDRSVNFIHSLFDALPPHLMKEGVTKDARFAVLTREDQFKCGKNDTINLDAVLGATSGFIPVVRMVCRVGPVIFLGHKKTCASLADSIRRAQALLLTCQPAPLCGETRTDA